MTDILERQFRTNSDAVDSRVGDETVLLHLTKGNYYGLDETGTRVWAGLKDGRSPREICKQLADEFGVPEETVAADVRRFLEDLEAHDIISGA